MGKFNNHSSLTDPPVRVCYGTRQRRHDSVGLIGRQVRFPLLLFLPPSPFVSLLCPPTQHSERPARAWGPVALSSPVRYIAEITEVSLSLSLYRGHCDAQRGHLALLLGWDPPWVLSTRAVQHVACGGSSLGWGGARNPSVKLIDLTGGCGVLSKAKLKGTL